MKIISKITSIALFSILVCIEANAQVNYNDGGDVPTSINIKNSNSSSNGYYGVDLTPRNGRAAGGISIGLSGSFADRWYLYNMYMLNGQLKEDFNINYGGSNKMVIKKNGKIGMGTDDPTHELAVNGTVRSKEIICDANPWPDYVFKKDYKLISLLEVERYIEKNGHLPNIPSAKEVEKEGVALASMNAKLLEKIEELTLYTLEQEKKINFQLQELEVLKNQTTQLQILEKRLAQMESKLMDTHSIETTTGNATKN